MSVNYSVQEIGFTSIKLCSVVFYLFIKAKYTFNTDPLLEVLAHPFLEA